VRLKRLSGYPVVHIYDSHDRLHNRKQVIETGSVCWSMQADASEGDRRSSCVGFNVSVNLLVDVGRLVGEDDEGIHAALLGHVALGARLPLADAGDAAAAEAGADLKVLDSLAGLALQANRRRLDARLLRGNDNALLPEPRVSEPDLAVQDR